MNGFDRFVGVPFVDRGRSLNGCDCYGLMHLIFREMRGVELPSFSDRYVTAADARALAGLIAGELEPWRPIEAGSEQAFDGVLMREAGLVRHIGVVVLPGLVLHVDHLGPSRIERYRVGVLKTRVVGFYRLDSR